MGQQSNSQNFVMSMLSRVFAMAYSAIAQPDASQTRSVAHSEVIKFGQKVDKERRREIFKQVQQLQIDSQVAKRVFEKRTVKHHKRKLQSKLVQEQCLGISKLMREARCEQINKLKILQQHQRQQKLNQEKQLQRRREEERRIKSEKLAEKKRVEQQRLREKRLKQEQELKIKKQQEDKALAEQKRVEAERQQKLERERQQSKRKQQERIKIAEDNLKKQKQEKLKKENELRSLQYLMKLNDEEYLQTLIDYAKQFKQGEQIATKTNAIGDLKKVIIDFLELSQNIINSFDFSKQDQVNTFMVTLWDMIVNKLLKAAKKTGLEEIPPSSIEDQVEKNCINTYILFINYLRVHGFEKIWIYFVGKTLQLLDFVYKRKNSLESYKGLDLIAKGYLKFTSMNCQEIYVSRLDQLLYFLCGLLLLNPIDCFNEIIERTNQQPDNSLRNQLQALNKPWNYSTFWIVVNLIRKCPFKYFKPVCFMNIISLLYIEVRKQWKNNNFQGKYSRLCNALIKEGLSFEKQLKQDQECKMLQSISEDTFDGENLYDLIEPKTKTFFKQKRDVHESKNVRKLQQLGSILYYFKVEQPHL